MLRAFRLTNEAMHCTAFFFQQNNSVEWLCSGKVACFAARNFTCNPHAVAAQRYLVVLAITRFIQGAIENFCVSYFYFSSILQSFKGSVGVSPERKPFFFGRFSPENFASKSGKLLLFKMSDLPTVSSTM